MTLYEQTLKQWMCERTSATPLPVVTEIFEQIVSGLDYIHSQGITHHDIKVDTYISLYFIYHIFLHLI